MVDVFQDMEKMLAGFNRGVMWGNDVTPRLDVAETKDAYEVHADLPGFAEKDIEVQVEGKVLTVSAKREDTREQDGKTWHVVERSYGSFSRSVTLPHAVDSAKVEATFADGVLKLVLPKPEAAKIEVKRIAIKK
jgi:HSP20 family protein